MADSTPLTAMPVLPEPEKIAAPPDWTQVFGKRGPLELEIGAGHGGFALSHCAAHPTLNYVAIEWRHLFAEQIRAKAEKKQLANLLVLRADAKLLVPRLFAPASLSAIRIHFPDPWWKRRHFKRRLLDAPFAALLRALLRPEGLMDVRTDVEGRGLEMMQVLEAAGFHHEAGAGRFAARPEGELPSSREHRYLASGEPVFRLRMRP